MEEYSDLKFDGDLSFLNENLDAAKYAEKEAIIKKEIVREESARSAREEFERKELERAEAARLAREEFEKDELARNEAARIAKEEFERLELEETNARLLEEEMARLAQEENDRLELEKETARLAQEELEKAELEKETLRMAQEEADRMELEKETARLAQEELEKAELEKETIRLAEEEALTAEENLETPAAVNFINEEETDKSMENIDTSPEMSTSDANAPINENVLSPSIEQGLMKPNFSVNTARKSHLEELVLSTGYDSEMFDKLKMELLELEKEKIILKYKQDLMMMIIKS